MDIFDIFSAASFEYDVYSNLAATDLPFLTSTSHAYLHTSDRGISAMPFLFLLY
jgi:hypothetical protein